MRLFLLCCCYGKRDYCVSKQRVLKELRSHVLLNLSFRWTCMYYVLLITLLHSLILHADIPGVRHYDGLGLIMLFILVGWDRSSFVCCLVQRGSTDDLLLQIFSGVIWQNRELQLSRNALYPLSPRLWFFIVLNRDLFVYRDDSIFNSQFVYLSLLW